MLRKRWFRWLSPGLNIKRWLALFSVGVGLLIIGISLMFNYQWLAVLEDIVLAFSYDLTGFYNYNVLIAVGFVLLSIGAILMLIAAGRLDLLRKTFQHGKRHLSPNSGYPEAALALVLGCRFGGPHDYFGEVVDKPYIGEVGRELSDEDLQRAVQITQRTEWLALGLSLLVRLLLILLIIWYL